MRRRHHRDCWRRVSTGVIRAGSRDDRPPAAGRLADILWRFSRDVMGYALRAQAYALMIEDRFPSFDAFSPAREPALA